MSSERPRIYNLRLATRVTNYLARLDKTTASRVLDKLEVLKNNPYHFPGTKALTGRLAGLYRLRMGNYRAVYQINEDGNVVIVLVLAPRGNVYKKGAPGC